MKNNVLPLAVRKEISAAKTHVTEKQVNDRIKIVIALSFAFVVIAGIVITAVACGLKID